MVRMVTNCIRLPWPVGYVNEVEINMHVIIVESVVRMVDLSPGVAHIVIYDIVSRDSVFSCFEFCYLRYYNGLLQQSGM